MLNARIFAAVALLVCTSPAALGDELRERSEIQNSASELFLAGNFAGLERMANDFRDNQSKTSSGTWKLPELYTGVSDRALRYAKSENAAWEKAMLGLSDWVDESSTSPTPYVAMGAALMGRGEVFRGTSWARQVDKADLERYYEYASRAGEFLIENAEVASNDPHWYVLVARVYRALGVNKDAFMMLVNEGIDKFPNYDQLYFEAASYLSAKWFGSDEELEAFAKSAIERTHEERGYALYARIYWSAGLRSNTEYAFQSPNANWYLMERGMDDVLEKFPSQWNINHFAYFSCYFWHEQAARKYMAMIEEPIDANAWNPPTNYDRCRNVISRLDGFNQEIEEYRSGSDSSQ